MRCNYCEWRCEIGPDKFGVCQMYYQDGASIRERYPNRWSTYSIFQIEAMPFYHVYPGSRSLTIGTASCNLSCRYCANAFIAKVDPAELQNTMYELTPRQLVKMAIERGCHNIIFNVNEPAVSLQSLLGLAEEAKAAGIPLGCLTNAFMTEESAELMASIFSFMNISLKSISSQFCRKYLGISDAKAILRNISNLASKTFLEITTPVIQSVNDNEIDDIASFIANVDANIPWHVFRLLPEYKMKEAEYPNIEVINAALEKARHVLPYIYFHNFVGSDWVNTACPECGEIVIERFSLGCGGDKLNRFHCDGNKCQVCGNPINIHGERLYWNSREVTA